MVFCRKVLTIFFKNAWLLLNYPSEIFLNNTVFARNSLEIVIKKFKILIFCHDFKKDILDFLPELLQYSWTNSLNITLFIERKYLLKYLLKISTIFSLETLKKYFLKKHNFCLENPLENWLKFKLNSQESLKNIL